MTSVSPDARRVWRAARGPVAIVLMIVVAGVVIALIRGGDSAGSLDPDSVAPSGSRALARLLAGQGVEVRSARSAAEVDTALAGGPATLLITHPELVRAERLAALVEHGSEAVLIDPSDDVLGALHFTARTVGTSPVSDRPPACALMAAQVAGIATMGGTRYQGGTDLCYGATLVRSGAVTVLGTGLPLTNERLDEQGNAALALRLLGQHERLVWYLPSPDDSSARAGQRSLLELLPDGWKFGLLQAGIAVVLLALWRARRLGPVVSEPLPVVVRAAETVEGRAHLYRRAGAADHAADALRGAVLTRVPPRLGLPGDAPPHAVAEALAERTGRDITALRDLLYGPAPTGDAALVRLADALDALEKEVGRR